MRCFTTAFNMQTIPLKILLVDDSTIVLQRVQQLLHESLPIDTIKITLDGDDAVKMATIFLPHIILLDISLPTKNGIEALKEIKTNHPAMKVVMFTSQPADQYKDLCLQYGADAYIDKTIEFESVPEIVKQLML